MNRKVLCIGSLAKDVFFPTVDGRVYDTPEEIESQRKIAFELGAKFQVEDRFEAPGGCAANVAQGLARLGIEVDCYSKIGDDQLGRWILSELENENVGTKKIIIEKNCKSDLSAIIVDKNTGERIIFFNRDANEKLEMREDLMREYDWFFISALNGNWEDTLQKVLELAEKQGTRIALNPGQRNIKDNSKAIIDAIAKTEVFMSNKDEAIEILNELGEFLPNELNEEKFLIEKLHGLGAKVVSITDGERGVWASNAKEIKHVNADIVEALDTTGAGDSFSSAFLAAYIKGMDIESASKWGVENSKNVVRFYGAKEGLLHEQDLQNI